MSLGNEHKERLVNAFLRGESVTDLSAFYAVTRTSVEDVLREAIHGLAQLNQQLRAQMDPPHDPMTDEIRPVTDESGVTHAERVVRPFVPRSA